MTRAWLIVVLVSLASGLVRAGEATEPQAAVKAFIADYKAWHERVAASAAETRGLRGKALQRKTWELGDRAETEYALMAARHTPPGFRTRRPYFDAAWAQHDPAAEIIVSAREEGSTAVVTTHRAIDNRGLAGFPAFTIYEYSLRQEKTRWLLTSIKTRPTDALKASETFAVDGNASEAEDPKRVIATYQWDVLEPALEGRDGRAALNVLLQLGHRCRLRLEQDLGEGLFGHRLLPPRIDCRKQLGDRHGNSIMSQSTVVLTLPNPVATLGRLFAVLPDSTLGHIDMSQETIIDWPHCGRTVYRDDNLAELQGAFAKRAEVLHLEGQPAKAAIDSLLASDFQCGFRDWQPRTKGAATESIACARPAPYELKGCFGFLYFDLVGSVAPDAPEMIFWSERHHVRHVQARCGSFNSLSFEP